MGIRRNERVVVRPDGTLERVAAAEPSSDECAEAERLGARFDELMRQDERGAPAPERDMRSSLLPTPARPPWRDPAPRAATPTADQAADQATDRAAAGRDREKERPKVSSTPDRPDDDRADPSAAGGAPGAPHAKDRKGGDREGGRDSEGEQGDGSAAMMALPSETARPQPAGGASAGASAPPPSSAPLIAEVANEVASRITTGSAHGGSQVRIDLRDEVLPQTSLTVENQAGVVVVTLSSGSSEAAELLSSHAAELGRAISRRTGKSTRIDFAGRSWTTDADGGTAGDTSDVAPDHG
jgi:Type III secretion protein (HpaP)